MFRRLLSVSSFTLLSRITGFARDICMAWILGKGLLSDAFIVAFLFPNYFRSIFGEGTINPAFLPRYAALHARGERLAAARFSDQVFSWQMMAQLVILVIALVAMPVVVRVVAPGFAANPVQFDLTVHLSRITFPCLILTVVAVQISAMLNAIEKFWAAAAWSNFVNVAMIAALLGSRWFPNAAYAAAWGVLTGSVAQLFFILWAGTREGLSLRISWPRWTPEIKEFFLALGAVTFGAASVVVAPLIDNILASLLPTGSRTALYYADRINQLPLGVLGIALGTVLLPQMSAKLAVNDRAASDAAQNEAVVLSLLSTLPFAAVFLVIPDTIMRGIFAHGAFDRHAAELSAVALATYGIGLPAFALVRIVASTFYARHDTMTPARITAMAIAVNVMLKIGFVWGLQLGIAGIALGTSLAAWVNVAALTFLGYSRGLLQIDAALRRAFVPTLLAAAGAGAGAFAGTRVGMILGARADRSPDLVELACAIVFGIAAYAVITLALRGRLPLARLARAT